MNSLYGGLDDTHPFYDPLYDSYHPLSEGLISETEGSAERLNLTGENNNVLEGQQEDSATLARIEGKKTGERPVTSEEEPEYKKRRIGNVINPSYPVSPVPNTNAIPSYLPTPLVYSVPPVSNAIPFYPPTPPVYSVPSVSNAIPTHLQIAPWQSPPAYPMPPAIVPNPMTYAGQFTSLPRALTLEELMAPQDPELYNFQQNVSLAPATQFHATPPSILLAPPVQFYKKSQKAKPAITMEQVQTTTTTKENHEKTEKPLASPPPVSGPAHVVRTYTQERRIDIQELYKKNVMQYAVDNHLTQRRPNRKVTGSVQILDAAFQNLEIFVQDSGLKMPNNRELPSTNTLKRLYQGKEGLYWGHAIIGDHLLQVMEYLNHYLPTLFKSPDIQGRT